MANLVPKCHFLEFDEKSSTNTDNSIDETRLLGLKVEMSTNKKFPNLEIQPLVLDWMPSSLDPAVLFCTSRREIQSEIDSLMLPWYLFTWPLWGPESKVIDYRQVNSTSKQTTSSDKAHSLCSKNIIKHYINARGDTGNTSMGYELCPAQVDKIICCCTMLQ